MEEQAKSTAEVKELLEKLPEAFKLELVKNISIVDTIYRLGFSDGAKSAMACV